MNARGNDYKREKKEERKRSSLDTKNGRTGRRGAVQGEVRKKKGQWKGPGRNYEKIGTKKQTRQNEQ